MKVSFRATLILLTTALIWGFAFVAQVLGGDHIGAFTFNGLRFTLGGLCLIPVYLLFERKRDLTKDAWRQKQKKTLIAACFGGVALFVASALQQIGATMTRDPGTAGFMTGLYTILTPIFYLIIFKKKSPWNTWVGVVLAVVGLYLLCLKEGGNPSVGWGEVLLLLGSLFWAAHILIVDHFVADISPLHFSSWQFILCGVLSMLVAVFTETLTWDDLWAGKWSILYCGLLSVGVAYTLQTLGQKYAPPTYAAIVLSTESVFAAVGGVLWNLISPANFHVDQDILPIGYVGCAIIFAGIVLAQLDFSKPKAHGRDTNERKTI